MDRKEYADSVWRKIELAHDLEDPVLHESALRVMAKADKMYESIQNTNKGGDKDED